MVAIKRAVEVHPTNYGFHFKCCTIATPDVTKNMHPIILVKKERRNDKISLL